MSSTAPPSIPVVTAEQMREVDRTVTSEFGIELSQMMENAGRNLADLAIGSFEPQHVVVLAGPGGNGGGGLVAARHLINRERHVDVVLSGPAEEMAPVTAHQLDILHRMEARVIDGHDSTSLLSPTDHDKADLVIDALLGYSVTGHPRGTIARLVHWTGRPSAPILSLDSPSGLDVTTGVAGDPCVRATATMTLALPKAGLLGAPQTGRLYLADISVPRTLYRTMGIDVGAIFAESPIVPVEGTSDG